MVSGVIYENTDITKRVEEEYQRKKREEVPVAVASSEMNMKKKKVNSASMVGTRPKDKDCLIY